MTTSKNGIITLAYGSSFYLDMAKTLARSLLLHSPHIPRAIVTDCPNDFELNELFTHVIPLVKQYGSNVVQKLHLNKYSPFENTLFIDSDCIVVRDIDFIFESLYGKSFCVIGNTYLCQGQKDDFVNVDEVLTRFNIDKLPKFNGGLYYFDKSQVSQRVFETARELLLDWKNLGITEFRGNGPNDERIIGIAMMLHNQSLFQDNGEMMRTPIGLRGFLDIDTFTSKSTFKKYDQVVSPAIVHFACVWAEHPVYIREAAKLKNSDLEIADKSMSKMLAQIKYIFGYQIAFVRYLLKRVPKNHKYIFDRSIRFLKSAI